MINQLPEKLYYNIGEISNAFGVKPSLIRFWEKEFNIINPKKSNKGTRKFSIKDVEKINLIYSLVKKKGYKLEGAKKQILNGENGNLDVLKRLQKIRLELLRMKDEL
jgi:DNA-binding transcriptional MerR regulator